MNLGQIRTEFIKLSGRRDLDINVTDLTLPYKKNADFYIQAGCKWLDLQREQPKVDSRYSKDLAVGGFEILIPDVLVIKDVYIQGADKDIIKLKELSFKEARRMFAEPPSQLTNAVPSHYAFGVSTLAPAQIDLTATTYTGEFTYDFEDIVFAGDSVPGDLGRYAATQLLILPPTDVIMTVTVVGKFYSPLLVDDTDSNYWATQHWDLLIQASLRQLEVFYRNSEGIRDWENAMETTQHGIEKEVADQESHDTNRMEG